MKDTRDSFLSVMKRRYACKLYDTTHSLSRDTLAFIMEAGRLSPSSFGLEHWHFWVLTSDNSLSLISEACFSQDAVATSPAVVCIMCRQAHVYAPSSPFVAERASRFPGGLLVFLADYSSYYAYLETEGITNQWARSQCYIAAANLMSAAASCDVDSCPIEGFDNRKVLSTLSLDPNIWQTGLIVSLGYGKPDEADRLRIRMNSEDIVTYV
ncbi:MAG TPA: nitroreductase family protein [Treponemataceae bacterium]|nr:nitroreductase family protein [Treponemataceae bacterium]